MISANNLLYWKAERRQSLSTTQYRLRFIKMIGIKYTFKSSRGRLGKGGDESVLAKEGRQRQTQKGWRCLRSQHTDAVSVV